ENRPPSCRLHPLYMRRECSIPSGQSSQRLLIPRAPLKSVTEYVLESWTKSGGFRRQLCCGRSGTASMRSRAVRYRLVASRSSQTVAGGALHGREVRICAVAFGNHFDFCRPDNLECRIVPTNSAGRLGIVELRHLVEDLRLTFQTQEAVCATFWDVDHVA